MSPSPIQPSDLHPWKKYLPGKEIRIIISVVVIVGLLYAFHGQLASVGNALIHGKPLLNPSLPAPIIDSPKTGLSIDKDTDGDGLPDWQEVLIGTDPYTPNKPDQIPPVVRDLVNTPNVIGNDDKLALAIYQRATTDPVGNTIEEQVAAATSKEILDLADSMDHQLTTYTYNDINVVDDTPATNTAYENQSNAFIKKIALDDAAIKKIYTALLQGQSIDQTFSGSFTLGNVNTLLDMPVPIKLAEQHLVFTNAFAHAYESLQKVATQKDMEQTTRYAYTLIFQKNLNLMEKVSSSLSVLMNQ